MRPLPDSRAISVDIQVVTGRIWEIIGGGMSRACFINVIRVTAHLAQFGTSLVIATTQKNVRQRRERGRWKESKLMHSFQ